MSVEILTRDDLVSFGKLLISDFRKVIAEVIGSTPEPVEGYRTKDVRKILGCSVNKLVLLRVTKKIRTKKLGGTLYYNKEDVKRLLQEGYC